MRDYVLMTDSCCDLTDYMARELELEVLPLTMHMDGRDYPNDLAGTAISNEEFYKRIRAGKLATTSAVNVGQFQDAMRRVLQSGKDIVCVCFSSALSTTYQSAVIAADDLRPEFPEAEIHVVDSLSASLGQGLLLYLAPSRKRGRPTAAELAKWVEENRLSICHWFTVDDLNYLKMGGRVSATTALVGTMLSIKPIMHTSDEGKLVPVSKARGRKAAIKALLDKIGALGIRPEKQTMFICHADCEEDARAVAQQIKDRFGTTTVYINYIGPVIGSHTGPKHHGHLLCGHPAMNWIEVHIDTQPAELDGLCARLEELGITGLVIDDEADFKNFLENNHQYWDYVDESLLQEKKGLCRVTFYLSDDEDGRRRLAAAEDLAAALPGARLSRAAVQDADWENNWKQFYKPMEIGEAAAGHPGVGAGRRPGPGGAAAEPGTFGTGSHATTRLCLQALDAHISGGERVLDLGCGSGILSIAALRLGAAEAFACDIDDKCVDVAYENAAINGIGRDRYTVRWGNVVTDRALQKEFGGEYDVVVANIVADVIIGISPRCGRF